MPNKSTAITANCSPRTGLIGIVIINTSRKASTILLANRNMVKLKYYRGSSRPFVHSHSSGRLNMGICIIFIHFLLCTYLYETPPSCPISEVSCDGISIQGLEVLAMLFAGEYAKQNEKAVILDRWRNKGDIRDT